MQLKIKRSQRETGLMSKATLFCLDATVQFTADESASLNRYKMWKEGIYSSEAAQRAFAKSNDVADGSMMGGFKSLAHAAMGAMRLNITVGSLSQGQHIECKSLDELLGAEEAIMTACRNLRVYLDTAATFDGREVLFDFSKGEPEAVASSATPQPALVAPPVHPAQETVPHTAPESERTVEYAQTFDNAYSEPPNQVTDYMSPKYVVPGIVATFVILLFVAIINHNSTSVAAAAPDRITTSVSDHMPEPADAKENQYSTYQYTDMIYAQTRNSGFTGPLWIQGKKVLFSQDAAKIDGPCSNYNSIPTYHPNHVYICEP